jgi:hypothetical protein
MRPRPRTGPRWRQEQSGFEWHAFHVDLHSRAIQVQFRAPRVRVLQAPRPDRLSLAAKQGLIARDYH